MNYKPLHAYYKVDPDILPDELKEYADEFTLFQHRMLTRRWLRHTDTSGRFTLLKREIINAELTKPIASKLLRWGKESGMVQCDDLYVEGEKSYGYRLRDDIESIPKAKRRALQNTTLVKRIREFEHRDSRHYTKAHRHLRRWHERITLSCDAIQTAIQYSTTEAQREANTGAVRMLMDGQFTFGVCDYGRVHTNTTRLFRPIRRHLFLDGSPLVNIDIANSQPLFVGVCILDCMGSDSSDPRKDQSSPIRWLNGDFQSCKLLSLEDFTTKFKMPQTRLKFDAENGDILRYLDVCSNGGLYRQLMEEMNWTQGKDQFKSEIWFHFLYGSNKSDQRLSRPDVEGLKRLNAVFRRLYPAVYEFIWSMKQKNYKSFSQDMQRAESSLMIDRVGSRLADDFPEIPILSIHDSYLTTSEHVETVKGLILSEFAGLGIEPTLGVEDYGGTHDNKAESDYEPRESEQEDIRES